MVAVRSVIRLSHRYTAVGTFTVTLYVTDNNGTTRHQQQTIVISSVTNTPPIATFDVGCAGLTCTANAQLSSDPDGSITRYAWTFGDGTTDDGAFVGHTYAAAGTYTMTLAVTDNAGATATSRGPSPPCDCPFMSATWMARPRLPRTSGTRR